VVQVFTQSPRAWKPTQYAPETLAAYRDATGRQPDGLPTFCHATYLINLASPDPERFELSRSCLAANLAVARGIGAQGLVLHAGSHLGAGFDACLAQVATALIEALEGDRRPARRRGRMPDPRREHRRGRGDRRAKPRRAGPPPGRGGRPARHRGLPRHPAPVGGRDPLRLARGGRCAGGGGGPLDRPGPPPVPARQRLGGPLRRPPRPPRQHRRGDDRRARAGLPARPPRPRRAPGDPRGAG
jgi:hypothetical protein